MGHDQGSIQRVILAIVLFLALPMWSCSDDFVVPPGHKPRATYKDLSADGPRDNVLYNLQLAYNDRNINRYDELLDDDFVFYFSEYDFQNGVVTVEYWRRAAEINANKNLFDPNYTNPLQDPVQDMDLSLAYPAGDDQWTPVPAPDQVRFPGETWYRKTVTYSLTVKMPGDFQYICDDKQADFVVRVATEDSEEYWQIVLWSDDVGAGLRDIVGRVRTVGFVEPSTWGKIKSSYSE